MVRRRLQAASSGGPPPVVGLRGPSDAQLRLVQSLVVTGLRLKVRIVSHLRVAEVPLSSCATRVCQAADLVVVESSFGARAVQYALRLRLHLQTRERPCRDVTPCASARGPRTVAMRTPSKLSKFFARSPKGCTGFAMIAIVSARS